MKDPTSIMINRELHRRIKIAAIKRRMKLEEFVDYIIKKGMNYTSRKQP